MSGNYKWWVLGAISVGLFVSVLDQTAITLAIPVIADQFDASIPTVQWVLLGYILTTSALMLPMGRLSDLLGRKPIYVAGLVIFLMAAIGAGLAPSLVVVIGFKIIQGIGASMIQANSMAIVTSIFPDTERGKAIGLLMTVVGIGGMSGPVIGGAIVELLGWRFIFFQGVPLGLVSIVISMIVLRSEKGERKSGSTKLQSFDWVGAGLSAVALCGFLLGMTFGQKFGWGSPLIIGGFVLVSVLFFVFIRWEFGNASPMFPLELFRIRRFSTGVIANFLSFVNSTSIFFLMPFYFQKVRGQTPLQTGLLLVATPICFSIIGPLAGRLSDQFGAGWFIIGGLIISTGAFVGLSQLTGSTPVLIVVALLVAGGIGMASFFSPNASAVLGCVERSRYGIATAFLNMVRNTATVTGLAVVTTIVTTIMTSHGLEPSLAAVGNEVGGASQVAFTIGLSSVFQFAASLNALAVVISVFQWHFLGDNLGNTGSKLGDAVSGKN